MTEKLTREEALSRFREMWSWIAEESKKRCRKIHKEEYFEHIGADPFDVQSRCYLCEYSSSVTNDRKTKCESCPILFGTDECCDVGSPYAFWQECEDTDWRGAAYFAKMIAELPERPLR